MHFQRKSVFGSCRVHFFTNTHHFWFVEFIRLLRGSFNDFGKITFLGSKTPKLCTKNMHFQRESVFGQSRVCFFSNAHHFWFVDLFYGSFQNFVKITFLGSKTPKFVPKYAFLEKISFRAVKGAFLHQCSPFLVSRLDVRLFYGSFKDFVNIKNGEIGNGKYAFCFKVHVHQCRVHFFTNYCHLLLTGLL